jgi:hypothetical protein
MSYERAVAHKCADGIRCVGHKVTTKYTNEKIGKLEAKRLGKSEDTIFVTASNFCNRCNQSCSTEIIENQNYRDMTGRGGRCVTRKKKEVVEPEYRDPETGMTIKEMKEDSARKLKKDKQKQQAKFRKENIEFVNKLIKSGYSREEIKTVLMAGIKKN